MAEVCEGECIGRSPGDEPLTLTRCHNCGLPLLFEGRKFVCVRAYNLKGINGKIFFFCFVSFYCRSFHVCVCMCGVIYLFYYGLTSICDPVDTLFIS